MDRITLEEALKKIEIYVDSLGSEQLSSGAALGRVLLENCCSPIQQPPFPRSPLDGYALRGEDSHGAGAGNPVCLRVIDRSFAGVPAKKEVTPGTAVRVMTGGVIPLGADCVIRQEDTDCGEEWVQLYRSLHPNENYCRAGEDFDVGTLLARKGTGITAGTCAVFAAAGITHVTVNRLPRVAVLSTGSELRQPGSELSLGTIYDTNGAYLENRLRELKIPVTQIHSVPDQPEELTHAINSAIQDADFMILSGGVSVGQRDLVPWALETLGGTEVFHGVAVKPGMPAALYIVQGKPVLALSGNPFACVVTFELLGRKVLACLSGDARFLPVVKHANLLCGYEKNRPIRRFFSGVLSDHGVRIQVTQQNGQTHMLAESNCIVELPAGKEPIPVGTLATVHLL